LIFNGLGLPAHVQPSVAQGLIEHVNNIANKIMDQNSWRCTPKKNFSMTISLDRLFHLDRNDVIHACYIKKSSSKLLATIPN